MTEQVAVAPQAAPAPPPAAPAEIAPIADQNAAEQAPAEQQPADKPAESTDEQPEKRSQSRFERRLNKVYRKFGEEKARADILQKQLDELRAPKAPVPEGAPKLEQFDDIEKYAEAKADWAKAQALKEHEARQRQESQQRQQQQVLSAWEEKTTKAEAKYEDFDEVVGEIQPVNPLSIAIMRAENGPDVAYYLGKNPKEAMQIVKMDPVDQILAVGRLAAKIASEPPAAKQPSKAPPPITPVSGTVAAPSDELSPDDDMRTFIRKRERQLGRRK